MRTREVAIGVMLLLLVMIPLTVNYPPVDDLWVENPYWNGLSKFYSALDPIRVNGAEDLIGIDPTNSTLFLVGPSRDFSDDDVQLIEMYLQGGGRVILLDDFGSGNQILEELGLATRFNGSLLREGVFFDPEPEFPRIMNFSLHGVDEVLFNYGTVIELGEEARGIIRSSPVSYLQGGNSHTQGYPVIMTLDYGAGGIVLVSDSSVFLNSMIDRSGNRDLLHELLRGEALIDVAHSHPTQLLRMKWLLSDLYSLMSILEFRYGLLAVFMLLLYRYNPMPSAMERLDEVEKVLNQHPGWNKEQLEWLEEQRKRHGY